MEDFTQTLQLTHKGDFPDQLWVKIKTALGTKEGVVVKRNGVSGLQVSFPTYLYGKEYIAQLIKDEGFIEEVPPKKNIFQRLLDKWATDNESSLGGSRLDCCDLNK